MSKADSRNTSTKIAKKGSMSNIPPEQRIGACYNQAKPFKDLADSSNRRLRGKRGVAEALRLDLSIVVKE